MTHYVAGRFVVGDPDLEAAAECPTCRFDAVLQFPIYVISEIGVSTFGTYEGCARCYNEADAA